MAPIIIRTVENNNEWESFLATRDEANFLQSWYWGEFHETLGKSIQRSGFYYDEKLVGVMLSVIETAKRGKYLTVPGGPIIDWTNEELVKDVFEQMRFIAAGNKCVFVRIRPQLIEDEFSKEIFRINGCKTAPMHLTADLTSQLDIAKSEDELLAQMRKTTRYEIRQADKLQIKIITSTDEQLLQPFYELQLETAKRQKFVPFSYPFLFEQFKVFAQEKKALLFTATLEEKILAQAFVIFYGNEAVYHYGVSTEEGRKYPGAYLIQWHAIKEAKKRGLKHYNFWGVAPHENKNHRFYGVSVFKRGYGGEDIQYLRAQDLVINPLLYRVNYLIEKTRKIVRRV